MPREKKPSDKAKKAGEMFLSGMLMVDIAKNLGVSDGTVRSWKNRYHWGETSKKNKCNVAEKNEKENTTLQKKKRGPGAPKGNHNAKGNRGNPHPNPPPDATKHGAYKAVYWDTLDPEEKELADTVPEDEEKLLVEQIQLFSIRERRIMQAINKYRDMDDPNVVDGATRDEDKREFDSEEDEEEYKRLTKKKIAKGDKMPGNRYHVSTHTTNKDLIIARLEQELSTVQSKKTKAIEALSKIRLEREKLLGGNKGNEEVDEWIAAVLGEEDADG